MQHVIESESRAPFARTYAEPLSGLRISWGALLAGAVAILSVSWIVWLLGLAIVALVTHGSWASIKGSLIALWIIAIATTLLGSLVGGFIAGIMPGNRHRRIGAAHAFIAWGIAFIFSTAVGAYVLGSTVRTTATASLDAAAAAVQATGSAAGGAAGANVPLSQRAEQTLTSFGYSPEQARTMVRKAQRDVQQIQPGQAGSAIGSSARSAVDSAIDLVAAVGWSWWGTWFVSMILAVMGGAAGASLVSSRRLDRDDERDITRRDRELTTEAERGRPTGPGPFHPAPTT